MKITNPIMLLFAAMITLTACKKTTSSTPEKSSLLIKQELWYAQDSATLQATENFEYDSLNRQTAATTTIVDGNITVVENTVYYNTDSVVMTRTVSGAASYAEKIELDTNGLGVKYTEYSFTSGNRIASSIIQYVGYNNLGYLVEDSSVTPTSSHTSVEKYTYSSGNMIQATEIDSSASTGNIFVVVNTETEQYNNALNTIGLRNVGIYYWGLDSKNLIIQSSQTAPATGPYSYTFDSKNRVKTCSAPGNQYGPIEVFTYVN